jgi:2-octaprenyl-6-methoxyphenol hydroxylase
LASNWQATDTVSRKAFDVTDTLTRFDVAISGASFAGLALARGLSQSLGAGVRIAVIDRAVAPQGSSVNDGRAFAIWAGAKAVLDGLGVWHAIAPYAEPMTAIEISDSALGDGVRATRLTYDAKTTDGHPAAYMVPSAVLHQALYQSVAHDPAITWMAPVEANGVTLGNFAASITLSDGRVIDAALCVAAEGRASKLREAAGIKTMGWGYAQLGIVATVQFELPHNGVAIQHFLPGGPFAVLPLQDNRACITWSSTDAEAERVLVLDDAAFRDELDHRIGGRFGAITLIGKPQSWPLDVKIARELTAKRFALIGDAAHGVHPVAGQGVNLAFRDVAALVEVVTDAARIGLDLGNGPSLERYARWRRFDSTTSAAAYDGLNRVFSIDNTVLRAARGAGLGIVDQIPQLKQLIMTEAAGLSGDLPKMLRGERV